MSNRFVFLVDNMSETGEKCWSVLPKANDDILKCLALSTTQRISVERYWGGKKPEYINSLNQRISPFFLKLSVII